MDKIELGVFLNKYIGDEEIDSSVAKLEQQETIKKLNKSKSKEKKLLDNLPSQIVRRIDAGFARSKTVHPDTGKALYTLGLLKRVENIFETGTYWGYSTAYLAAALKEKKAGKVYTFDIYEKAGKHIPPEFMSYVELLRGRSSVEAMPEVLDTVIPELFFQDSRHDYEGVRQELEVVAPRLKEGAIVLFHDFVVPEVRQAALDTLSGYDIYVLDTLDPQQLGIAIKV